MLDEQSSWSLRSSGGRGLVCFLELNRCAGICKCPLLSALLVSADIAAFLSFSTLVLALLERGLAAEKFEEGFE